MVIKMVQLGPGMYTQTQADCTVCQGSGEIIKKADICKKCKGKKLILTNEKIEVPIGVGIPNKEKINIGGKGNEHPTYRAGDLIVIVQVEEDDEYKRMKNDLLLEKKISLYESLSGFKFNLKHLNDHVITIENKKNHIIKHGEVK